MQLVGLKGIYWSERLSLSGLEVTIGREAGNTIVCESDSSVSRRHARLIPGGLTYSIEDLGSANGTFVNGVRISIQTALNPGDEIRVGAQAFRFEAPTNVPATQPVLTPIRPREVSRGEQAQAGPISSGDLKGCAIPVIPDLSGLLKMLPLLVLALVAVLLLGGLLMALGLGVGALGGMFHGGSHPPIQQGGAGTGQPGQSQTGGSGGDQQDSNPGIVIKEVRITTSLNKDSGAMAPRVLLTWENHTGGDVHKILARVISLGAAGEELATANNVVVYDGKPVQEGATHHDVTVDNQGFDPPGSVKPDKVDVEVTRVE